MFSVVLQNKTAEMIIVIKKNIILKALLLANASNKSGGELDSDVHKTTITKMSDK